MKFFSLGELWAQENHSSLESSSMNSSSTRTSSKWSNDFVNKSQKLPFIFVSFQSPVTNFDPMNAWNPILKQIYQILVKELKLVKQQETIKMGDNIKVNCDAIGKMLFESYSYMAIKFIEEILDVII